MPHLRSPWFWSGLAFGLALGLWCTHLGVESARRASPPFPVISAEP